MPSRRTLDVFGATESSGPQNQTRHQTTPKKPVIASPCEAISLIAYPGWELLRKSSQQRIDAAYFNNQAAGMR
jgi:hypothetical protein